MTRHFTFSGFESIGFAATVVFAVLLTAVLCVSLLRKELVLVSRTTAIALLGLRLLILLLVLLILLRPGISWERDHEHLPELVVAIDVSGSMQLSDEQADAEEILRRARGIGQVAPDPPDNDLAAWKAAWDREPRPSGERAATGAGEMTEDRIRRELLKEISRLTRRQVVQHLLTNPRRPLLDGLQEDFHVRVVLFSESRRKIDPGDLESELASTRDTRSSQTDLAGVLNDVVTDAAASAIRAVILLSDGRSTIPGHPVDVARHLGVRRIPVFCVPVGSVHLPRDLIARPVDAPTSVFPKDSVTVRCPVAAAGFDGQQVTVRIQEGRLERGWQDVTVKNGRADAQFVLNDLSEGTHELKVEVDPLPGELSEENNSQPFVLLVTDSSARVLLIEQRPRWEFRFLRNLLERDERIDLETILLEQPFLRLLTAPAMDASIPEAGQLASRLSETDVLLLGDVAPDRLTESAWQAVRDAVEKDGMTLVVIPGPDHGEVLEQQPVLNELLPLAGARKVQAESFQASQRGRPVSAFRLIPRPEASLVPMFQLSETGDNAAVFGRLPGHPRIVTGNPRAGTTVWADAVLQTTQGRQSFPLVVWRHFGSGQVVWMGMDSTWRWRRRAGDRWHHRFWGQLIRWAVRNRAAATGKDVRLNLSADLITERQTVEAEAALSEILAERMEEDFLTVIIRKNDPSPAENPAGSEAASDAVAAVRMKRMPESSDGRARFRCQIGGLAAGRYELVIQADEQSVISGEDVRAELTVVSRSSPELVDVTADRDGLLQIARSSGGRVVEIDELDSLPKLLQRDRPVQDARPEQTDLWDHWLTLTVLILLLTCQWFLRKLSGLP